MTAAGLQPKRRPFDRTMESRMTLNITPHKTLAPLRNVAALAALVDRCLNRTLGMPGMATFYGPSGFGKTQAAIYATNRFQALYVEVGDSWTKKTLCEKILREVGQTPGRNVAAMIEQISEHMAMNDRPLLIDEADTLLKRGMIENVREIYDGSGAPVILIGEEKLPSNLQPIERVHGRMLDWVGASPGTIEDIGHLVPIYAEGIEVQDDLREKLLAASHGSLRRICVNLVRIREFSQLHGLSSVGMAEWGKEPIFTGMAPAARKGLL